MTGLRRILPSTPWIALVVIPYLLLCVVQLIFGASLALELSLKRGFTPDAFLRAWYIALRVPEISETWRGLRGGYVLVIAVIFGLYRAIAFHPATRRGYGAWLASTPWRHPQPLPFGPVTLTGFDLVVVGALGALVFVDDYRTPLTPAIAFGSAYALALLPALRNGGALQRGFVPLGLIAVLWAWPNEPLALAMLAGVLWVARRGVHVSLESFTSIEADAKPSWPAAHPFAPLSPGAGAPMPSWGEATGFALLSGALGGVVFGRTHDSGDPLADFAVVWGLLLVTVALLRLLPYLRNHACPISLWGRARTGRWIVPGYDVIFVGPLAILAIGAPLPWMLVALGLPLGPVAGLSIGIVLLLACRLPPSARAFDLTGQHRIRVQGAVRGIDLNQEVNLAEILTRKI